MGEVRIGISGWRYEPWRGVFYPPGLAQHRELQFASRAFNSIEINGSFYSLQSPESYQAWREAAGKWPYFEDVTADFLYLRLHGDKELYAGGYTEAALDRWADRIRAWRRGAEPRDAQRVDARAPRARSRDVFCYFDNDVKVRAPFDADRLMSKVRVERADRDFEFPSRGALRRRRPAPPLPPYRWRFDKSRGGRPARRRS